MSVRFENPLNCSRICCTHASKLPVSSYICDLEIQNLASNTAATGNYAGPPDLIQRRRPFDLIQRRHRLSASVSMRDDKVGGRPPGCRQSSINSRRRVCIQSYSRRPWALTSTFVTSHPAAASSHPGTHVGKKEMGRALRPANHHRQQIRVRDANRSLLFVEVRRYQF